MNLVKKWHLRELACETCGIDFNKLCGQSLKDRSIDIAEVIDHAVQKEYGCGYDSFEKIAFRLLDYTPTVDFYDGHQYHLFARKDSDGIARAVVMKEIEEKGNGALNHRPRNKKNNHGKKN